MQTVVSSKLGRKRVSFSVSESSVVVFQESPTPGPSGCSVQHAATFVNNVCAAKITRLDAPLAVILPRAARERAYNKLCGPLPRKVWISMT